jgi:hypothetical protein
MLSQEAQAQFDTFLEDIHQMMDLFESLKNGEDVISEMRSTFISFSEDVLSMLKEHGAEEHGAEETEA